MNISLSDLSGIIFLLAFAPYIWAIVTRKAQPSKATWIIMATLDVMAWWALSAVGEDTKQIAGATFGAIIVAALSFWYGTSGWTKIDKWSLACAFIGIVLWQMSGDPKWGIIACCVTGVIGIIPTIQSVWEDPNKEDKIAWGLFLLSCVIAFFTIPAWTVEAAAQKLTFLFNIGLVCLLIAARTVVLKRRTLASQAV